MTAKTPAQRKRPVELLIETRIGELTREHGSMRAVSRALGIDAGYLSRLVSGKKDAPSEDTLRKLGLVRVVRYVRASD